jgi:PAS domain S-box-containing protein
MTPVAHQPRRSPAVVTLLLAALALGVVGLVRLDLSLPSWHWQTILHLVVLAATVGAGLVVVMWRRRVQLELEQIELRFATIFDASPVGIAIARTRDNRIEDVNAAMLNLLGYTREQMLGRTAVELDIWERPEDRERLLANLRESPRLADFETIFRCRNGELHNILIAAELVTLNDEPSILIQATDITARKRAEERLRASEEQYRGLMESLDSVVATVDATGTFLYMNDVAARVLGGTPEALIGKTMGELFPGEIGEMHMAAIRRVIAEDVGLVNETETAIHSQRHWYRTTIQPIHDHTGRPIYALINSTDIHNLKLAQQELLELNQNLEERVRERTAELARAARAKDEFLANMSHELRTPMNAILGFSESLLEAVYGPLNSRQQAALQNVMASGNHLLALINEILDLAKAEAGRLDVRPEPVAVAEVCQASMLFVKGLARKKELTLALHVEDHTLTIEADPVRLKQMLVNLLSNAVKFTSTGGTVCLETSADAAAGVVRLSVQDSGIGIAPEDLALLFQPFTQLDASLDRRYEGSGLGLALVRRLAELHGGSCTAESEVGVGSRFTITLPWARECASA